jgi:hypothetical protein
VLVLTAVLGAALLTSLPHADAYPGAPWFKPSTPYTANFPDPSVIRVGGTYYAYGTATGGDYLPVMSSTDLVTWTARPAYDPGAPLNSDPQFNDALPRPASWAVDRPGVSGRLTKEVWAPGVATIGGHYVDFYAARVSLDHDRFCISVATASNPLGPFVDNTTAPLVCDADPNGSIDPQPFVDVDGSPWLLWKSEGVPGVAPTHLWARPLTADGTGFLPGSSASILLTTSQGWEGNLIESPSMVRYHGQLYLFYSGNEAMSANYAIGVATCASMTGPCTKVSNNPIIASQGDRLGPGGPSAFLDAAGQLRLAYHWWNAPYTSYPAYPACTTNGTCTTQGQRRLAVDLIDPAAFGAAVGIGPSASDGGYWIAHEGGGVQAHGAADAPTAASALPGRAVGIAPTPAGHGWWVASDIGGVVNGGNAVDHGNVAGLALTKPVVGIASTRSGNGYWLVASDGGVFSFGDARFFGSTGAMRLNKPVVGMAATPSGNGYWLVASDGGIFSFGDANFFGSTGSMRLNKPVVGMAGNPTGAGYWLVATDGGIFAFGGAPFLGSAGSLRLIQPVTGMTATRAGDGYWMIARDGGVFTYGSARFFGAG